MPVTVLAEITLLSKLGIGTVSSAFDAIEQHSCLSEKLISFHFFLSL